MSGHRDRQAHPFVVGADHHRCGAELTVPCLELLEEGRVDLHERLARLRVLPADRTGREAHEPHEGGGLGAFPTHIPDDGLPVAVVHLEEVVEVSTRLEDVSRGKVASRDIDPGDPWEPLRQEAFLERARDVVPFPYSRALSMAMAARLARSSPRRRSSSE